jgi:hypothetical protein
MAPRGGRKGRGGVACVRIVKQDNGEINLQLTVREVLYMAPPPPPRISFKGTVQRDGSSRRLIR